MVDVHPAVRLVLVLAGFGAIPAWMLARTVSRRLSTSLTVVVAHARLSGWCAALGRFLHAKLPAAALPVTGGRVLPTAGPVTPNAGPAVSHPRRAA